MNLGPSLLITFGLLAANAYFVGAEFAIMGSRRSRIEPLAENGKKSARTVLYALEHVTLMLATCQLGVTIASVALGAVAEPAIAHAIDGPIENLGVPESMVHPIAIVIALLLVVYAHVVIGEMVPKNLAVTNPERTALILGPPLVFISKLFYPVVASMNWVANHVIRLFGYEPKSEVASAFTADEVASIVEVSRAAGVLDADVGLISSAIEFSEQTAVELMVSEEDLETVPDSLTPEELEDRVAHTGYSRFPVVASNGVLIGYVHVKDILDIAPENRFDPIPGWKIRRLVTVDPDDEIETAMRVMQQAGAHMAEVNLKDGSQGVIFLEDVLEELIGEVRDAMQR
ncbi:HlyC/CorC family transporter [Arcanobacterium phocisimile]|uniref:HlyC/CorC family transporter n=1 Tax=Arcanobacterium phocisimile TaxID=1302235 RepID=A0ABX7IKY6_9ACTO|nr:hemolysin family protein [Arcanobacterium phocisimile]QRV02498.1 HlyC/CorC family transporter [Arcanobacterium phocisimile]